MVCKEIGSTVKAVGSRRGTWKVLGRIRCSKGAKGTSQKKHKTRKQKARGKTAPFGLENIA